jgi:2-C-methyl-D-erythritol 4-phosphate cytidylyltransferase
VAIALIVAAGRGERLGAVGPKALVELAGKTLLQWSVDVLLGVAAIEQIVVALPKGVNAPAGTLGVEGGRVRSESVRHALAAAGGRDSDLVLVHDAARPLLTAELVHRVLDAVRLDERLDGAIAAVPVTDTIKRVDDAIAKETLARSELWAAQTPQVFRRAALERALDVPDEVLAGATDDAWLVERTGGRVGIVTSSPENLKVTTELDLQLAGLLITGPDD